MLGPGTCLNQAAWLQDTQKPQRRCPCGDSPVQPQPSTLRSWAWLGLTLQLGAVPSAGRAAPMNPDHSSLGRGVSTKSMAPWLQPMQHLSLASAQLKWCTGLRQAPSQRAVSAQVFPAQAAAGPAGAGWGARMSMSWAGGRSGLDQSHPAGANQVGSLGGRELNPAQLRRSGGGGMG